MAPGLNCLSIFCSAESFWNPDLNPDAVLADYGRLVFGDELAAIGPLLEEFEVIPDWGYYAPFPYSPMRLQKGMAKLLPLLEKVDVEAKPRLPIAPTMADYRKSLLYFANLFHNLASVAVDLEEARNLAKTAGKVAANRQDMLSIDEVDAILAEPGEFPSESGFRKAGGSNSRV